MHIDNKFKIPVIVLFLTCLGKIPYNVSAVYLSVIRYGIYDFIVVGAGSSGSIIATRLSANSSVRVLLIEAGSSSFQFFQDIPLAAVTLQDNLDFNWNYTSEAQSGTCLAMKSQKCSYPRGKGLGGSSQINAMMYVRGNPVDYDSWAAEGCPGWDYKSVLPYFKKSEGLSKLGSPGMIDDAVHGKSGPMTTEFPRFRSDYSTAFVNGAKSIGITEVDYNSVNQLGVSYLLANTAFGRREDTGNEFITKLTQDRQNLDQTYESHVTRININDKTVIGVTFRKGGKIYKALVNKEVILSAGVINSPQILMLSGIGPAATLTSKGIPVLRNLPVGSFMPDHPSIFAPTYTTIYSDKSIEFTKSYDPFVVGSWLAKGGTQLSIPYSIECLAFGRAEGSKLSAGVPDIELMFTSASYATDGGLYQRENHRLTDNFFNTVYGPLVLMSNDSISTIVMLLHPKSVGNVTLRDTNPLSKPIIYHNMFSNPTDIKDMISGIRFAQKIIKSDPFKKYAPVLYPLNIPGCSQYTIDSDDHWACCLRNLATSMYHMVGTCRMGDVTDPTAVVAPDLKVHGIYKLRVADASVMRNINSGHTAAPSMMIGEKVSDIIKKQYGI